MTTGKKTRFEMRNYLFSLYSNGNEFTIQPFIESIQIWEVNIIRYDKEESIQSVERE